MGGTPGAPVDGDVGLGVRAGAFTGAPPGGDVGALAIGWHAPQARHIRDKRAGVGVLFVLLGTGFGELRIGEHAAGGMDQAPFILARHRIFVPAPQEMTVVQLFQFVQVGGQPAVGLHETADAELELLAALHQHLLLLPLGLKGDSWDLRIQGDGQDSGHQKYQQEGKSGFGAARACHSLVRSVRHDFKRLGSFRVGVFHGHRARFQFNDFIVSR